MNKNPADATDTDEPIKHECAQFEAISGIK